MTLLKSPGDSSHSWLSIVLVVTQFALIILIMFTGPLLPTYWSLRGVLVLGGVIGLWAFLAMGLRNLRAFPEIPHHGRLVVHGPYRWVRHPMYTSVLVITLAWMVEHPLPFRMGLWVGLVVTLCVKLGYEEQLLLTRFPSYEQYRKGTKRLIPFLF
ncbi:MAG: isoprenylcysteine carboxylmethyltransferase family protein [Nitrospirota bacterium]|nr:isoprenylcysteine carboxylmethyltransferase family protein [Nitrospirota bacterium]MDX2420285.1 isoprenylcysteine carboxylmethyltransferase family protein [Nitrospirota bacterium]